MPQHALLLTFHRLRRYLSHGGRSRLARLWPLLVLAAFAACQPAPVLPTETPSAGDLPKTLATVFISPTPNAEEQQATRAAFQPSPTGPPATPSVTPTVYIGTFQGEASSLDDAGAIALAATRIPLPTQPRPARLLAECPMQPDERFGDRWLEAGSSASTIGCPADIAIPYSGRMQVFERGSIYITPDDEVWVVAQGGATPGQWWFREQLPEGQPADMTAPAGLRAPTGNFARAWSGIEGVRNALGFARVDSQAGDFTVQLFQNGTLLLDHTAGQVFILVGAGFEGTASGPY